MKADKKLEIEHMHAWLKDDEKKLLHAICVGDAGPDFRLSPGRRTALLRRFERNGWTSDGKITPAGERMVKRNPLARPVEAKPQPSPQPQPAAEVEAATVADKRPEEFDESEVDESESELIEERQSDGNDDRNETDVQGSPK